VNPENQIVRRYTELSKKKYHTCPECSAEFEDLLKLRIHITKVHTSLVTSPEMVEAMDPLKHVKKFQYKRAEKAPLTMAKLFGDRISSSHNQCAAVLITGPMGVGKSNAAVYIAHTTANYLAEKYGKKPDDFFTMDNVAIMKLTDVVNVMKNLKKHNIYILDDIGASYSARDFNNKINKNFNKILQTFRSTNTLLIFTTPNAMLIDKVSREISHYTIEVTRAVHHKGISIGKLSEIKKLNAVNKTLYPFIQEDGVKYSRCMFKRIPDDLAKEYEAKRKQAAEDVAEESASNMLGDAEGKGKPKKERPTPQYRLIMPDVGRLKTDNPKMTIRQVASAIGTTDYSTVHKAWGLYKQENGINNNG